MKHMSQHQQALAAARLAPRALATTLVRPWSITEGRAGIPSFGFTTVNDDRRPLEAPS